MQAKERTINKQALVIGDRNAVEVAQIAEMGYGISFASSQAEAASKMREHDYDMVVTLGRSSELPGWDNGNKHLALLSDTVSQLLITDDPQRLVQSLCERIMEAIDCQAFFNFLVAEDKSKLHLNACSGIPTETAKSIAWLDFGVAVCGCVARDGERIVAEDIQNTPDPRTELVKGYGIQAYACHPLLGQGGKVIGTLSFGTKTRKRFANSELELMKTVADHVATAMERIRLLDVERRRAEELQVVLDAVPAIVWISHDPESRVITGNRASSELLRLPQEANASKTAPQGEAPTNFRIIKDGREIPFDELPVQMAAKGAMVKNCEIELLFDDGTIRYILGDATPLLDEHGQPRGSVAAFTDITERKAAEQRERELEAHQREFHRRTILAATEGKLVIAEKEDIERIAGTQLRSWHVQDQAALAEMRDEISALLRESGMDEPRYYGFLGCVIEAAANALKHAGGGEAGLYQNEKSIVFVMRDTGSGIKALDLPDVALTKHYSTAGTLGMGYKLMIRFADRLYLCTGPEGTTVVIEIGISEPAAPDDPLSPQVQAWRV